jgi:cyclohexyl-isocyanide hydratase
MTRIIELNPTENYGYKAFFMKGLQEHPNFFRISSQDELKADFPTLNKADSFTLGVINEQNELLGVVSFQREGENREKLRHKGLLFRMYVKAEASGQGIGKILVNEVIKRAKKLPEMEQINLTVIAYNHRAKSLYENFGFKSFSLEIKAIKYQNQYLDEEQMVLFLKT